MRRLGLGTHTRDFLPSFAAAIIVISSSLASYGSQLPSSGPSAGSFDAPIKKGTVDLGHSPYYPDDQTMRNTLSCFYFPNLLIKQYDQGQVGSQWVSILRSPGKLPGCKLTHEPGERVIDGSEWEGYFKGVKGNLVFFDGGESQFGALSFAVYDTTTGKKLFEDEAAVSGEEDSSRLRVFSTKTGVTVEYLRAYYTDCNLHSSEGRVCWEKLKAKLGLKSDHIPVCTGYDTIAKLVGTDDVESWIAYPVEVTLPLHPAIKPVAGTLKCWPSH